MGTLALIGLGSNLGDRASHLDAAVAALAQTPGVELRSVSRRYRTAPVGGPSGQGSFLNASAALETSLDAPSLLRALQAVERREGRLRTVRWGERTLDLDILLFGDQVVDTPDLTVPHPRMAVRRFALAPTAEIAPDAVDPLTGRSVADLLANLDRRPSCVALSRLLSQAIRALAPRLVDRLGGVGLSAGEFGADPEGRMSEPSGDRWIVLDGWPPASQSSAHPSPDSRSWPTFVVAGWAEAARGRPPSPSVSDAPQGRVPVLRVRGLEPSLASGGLHGDAPGPDAEGSILSEIVAACEASRAAAEPA